MSSPVAVAEIDAVGRTATVGGTTYRLVEYVMLDRETDAVIAADIEVFDGDEFVGTCIRDGAVRGEAVQSRRVARALRAIGAAWTQTPFVLRCEGCRAPATHIGEGKRQLVFACEACQAHYPAVDFASAKTR